MVPVMLKQELDFSLTHLQKAGAIPVLVKGLVIAEHTDKGCFQAVAYFYAKSSGENPANPRKDLHISPCHSAEPYAKHLWLAWVKVSNMRLDFSHTVASHYNLIYTEIYVEVLRIKNMVKNRHLILLIQDASWGSLFCVVGVKSGESWPPTDQSQAKRYQSEMFRLW